MVLRGIEMALQNDVRLPVPMPELEPRHDVSMEELWARWQIARDELRTFLRNLTPQTFDQTPFFHPAAGALNAQQLLQLSQIHTAYHARQIARIIDKITIA